MTPRVSRMRTRSSVVTLQRAGGVCSIGIVTGDGDSLAWAGTTSSAETVDSAAYRNRSAALFAITTFLGFVFFVTMYLVIRLTENKTMPV